MNSDYVMKITISGIVGSGKSTIAHRVADELGLEYLSIGAIQRKMAEEKGVSFDEFSNYAKIDKSIDLELDRRQREMNGRDSDFVMDSRLGFYFIPDSYKIYLKVDFDEAARRILGANRKDQKYDTFGEALRGSLERVDSENVRYKNAYNIDMTDESQFDKVIDTTHKTIKEVVEEVLESIPDKSC